MAVIASVNAVFGGFAQAGGLTGFDDKQNAMASNLFESP
jgi:hypothetical protein